MLKMTVDSSTFSGSTYYPAEADSLKFRILGAPRHGTLPHGFPKILDSPLAWTKSQIQAQEKDWILYLEPEEVESIEVTLRVFQGILFIKFLGVEDTYSVSFNA
jgi:hypothetical protein